MKVYLLIILIVSVLFFSNFTSVMAVEQTFITKSHTMKDVEFDGKWTHMLEWKHSALLSIYGDRTGIKIRTAHQDNNIYVLLDVVVDDLILKGKDRAVVCFDAKNDKSEIPDQNDFCFTSTLGRTSGVVLQGGSPLKMTNHFKNIPSPDGFISISTSSDKHDRYTSIPHATYEYRIPIEIIGRDNVYGFYVGVYDADIDKMYTWPENLPVTKPGEIPSPATWGEIISPDQSIPEFPFALIALLPAFLIITFLGFAVKKNSGLIYH